MQERRALACEFIKGADDYLNTDIHPLSLSPLGEGGTRVVARVAHASGEWIRSGEAFQTAAGVELSYHLFNNGEIAFELYGCELTFLLPELPFDEQTEFTLKHVLHYEES